MGAIISQQTIEEIRMHNDVADVLGSYLNLKRAGSSFKALCPFHKEKTPSFSVNPQRQSYHCFGCGVGGDVFKFVMEYEGVDFVTAAKLLARRAGLSIQFEQGDTEAASKKDELFKIHEELAQMYQRALMETDGGNVARRYLEARQLDEETITEFLIGYAPARRDTLELWAKKKGYSLELMEAAGLLTRSEGRTDYYDRFRGRLMFPIRDELSRVIGFSGRLLQDEERASKYVNSPETALFKKSRVLYALDKARRSIVDQRQAIVCEGQIDVIRCHQAGFTAAVAPQGTALTEDHARLLKRYAEDVVLVFDADQAGQNAALRSGEVCMTAGLSVQVAPMPPGKDPDSLIREGGSESFQDLLDGSQTLIDFEVDLLSLREDLSKESGLMRASRAVLNTIALAASDVQRDQLLRQAAHRLNLTEDALRRDLHRRTRRQTASAPNAESPGTRVQHPPLEVALAEALLQDAEAVDLVKRYLPLEVLTDPDCRMIIETLLHQPAEAGGGLMGRLAGAPNSCTALAAKIQASEVHVDSELPSARKTQDLILRIRRKHLERQKRALSQRAEEADEAQRLRLSTEHSQLTMEIERLRQGWEAALPLLEL